MNNEDPADPSVHVQRGRDWPEPVAHRVRGFSRGVPQPWRPYGPICPSRYLAEGADVETQALYTADQMREAVAAERERSHELLQAADHIRAGLEAKLAALSAALAEKEQPK